MALKAMLPGHTRMYVLKEERKTAETIADYEPTKFELRVLSAHEQSVLKNYEMGEIEAITGKMSFRMGSAILFAVRQCLTGWQNFKDENDNDIPFKGRTVTDKLRGASDEDIDRLRPEWKEELYGAIKKLSAGDEEDFV